MIKSQMAKRISGKRLFVAEHQVEKVVNVILDAITAALVRGDRVELRGFGVFSVHLRSARTVRNPRTGAVVQLGPRRVLLFKMGRQLRKRLNAPSDAKSIWITAPEPLAED